MPDGFGVFQYRKWTVHCGEVKDGVFQEGRKVSLNIKATVLVLINQKFLADESVLQKIERFSKQGVLREFFKDGQKIAKIIPRLNRGKDPQNWLSMQPDSQKWYSDE